MKKMLPLLFFFIFPMLANADCIKNAGVGTYYNARIKSVDVQGDRDDGHPYANKMLITLVDATSNASVSCDGKSVMHLDVAHKSYASLLSIALTAYTTKQTVIVLVNTNSVNALGNSYQLSTISISQ